MEMKTFLRIFLFFFLIIAFASQLSVVKPFAEARTCQSQSHGFHGTCLSNHNCGQVCKSEGFTAGECVGLRRRCFCTRPC
ncbi:defensin-like protein 1 [Impatiens glandulifera]|uniref:defensin-like protein 1 n=1 Tax=Impatiens glandulifera TaxID=253017 RepID=UPI001FB0A7C9|nr:defensin-like protein 1 [Impatiens glandulifera]